MSILGAGLIVIILLLVAPSPHNRAIANQQGAPPAQEDPYDPPYPPEDQTATSTTTPITTTVTAGTATTTTATTATTTVTASPSPTTDSPTTSTADSTQPTATLAGPTPTPTPSNDLTCLPGVPIEITGDGPPRAPFLLYFNQRAVSGGSVEPDGRFAIPLVVGNERPGNYEVIVRVRGTTQILRRINCTVLAVTPTPFVAQSFVR